MIPLIIWNLALAALGILLPNNTLMWESWQLYCLQAIVIIPYTVRRAKYASNLFMPSLFTLAFFTVNLCFGAYLVPRGVGYYKDYTSRALAITSYNRIVPYLLLCNLLLCLVTVRTLRQLESRKINDSDEARPPSDAGIIPQVLLMCGFVVCSYFDFPGAFSVQLALLVVHFGILSRGRASYRYLVYPLYLVLEVALNFDNKREIVIVLFLLLFFEAYYRRVRLSMSLGNVIRYVAAAGAFMSFVLTASILRGYGGFEPGSLVQAVRVIPDYIGAPVFQDAIVDNLELNYDYGSSVTAIDFTVHGKLPHLLGLSFWKVLFLPIPRDLVSWKPQSVLQLYTQAYDPTFWSENLSLPVVFSSEMYVNFSFFGLLPFALVWVALNKIFVGFHSANPQSFWYNTSVFLCVTTLIFARGSGMELYVLTYLLAVPVFVAIALIRPWRIRAVPNARSAALT